MLTVSPVLIVYKGGSARIKLTNAQVAGVTVGVGAAVAALVGIFFVPYLHRKVLKDDWELKWYHVFQGPLRGRGRYVTRRGWY